MMLHGFLRIVAALAVFAAPCSAYGQEQDQEKGAEKLRLSKAELAQYKVLSALVDDVIAGKEPAPADVKLTLQNHFVRSATNVFVPYILEITGGKFTSFPVTMYVRAVRKPGAAETAKPGDYPFTDLHVLPNAKSMTGTGGNPGAIARALELPPGEFDVYFALTDTPSRNGRTPAKRAVHVQTLTVPDFSGGLTTSSIILAQSMEEAPQPKTAQEQMEQPYTIGGQKITPKFTSTFQKTDEMLFFFLVYNVAAAPSDKPDIEVNYTMFRANESKPFGKLAPTSFNATTLPAEFQLSAGHQVLVAQGFPLGTFAPGEYKLDIALTDKVANQKISRAVAFTVAP